MRKSIYTLMTILMMTVFFCKSVSAQPGTMMPNQWVQYPAACGFDFFDDGGMAGPFMASAVDTITLIGNGTNKIQLIFNTFNVGAGMMYIYDGMDAQSTPIGPFTGSTPPPNITATNANGALTVRFVASTSMPGWNAAITCVGGGGGVNFTLNPGMQCAPFDISNLVTNSSSYDDANYWNVWTITRYDNGILKDSTRLVGHDPSGYIIGRGQVNVRLNVSSKLDSITPVGFDMKSTNINNDRTLFKLAANGGADICPHSQVSFQVKDANYNSAEYIYHGMYYGNMNTFQFDNPGPDTMRVHIFPNGCPDTTLSLMLNVNSFATPQPTISTDFGQTYCKNEIVRFSADANFASYYWDFDNGAYISTLATPEYAFDSVGDKTVRVIVTNSCSANQGEDSTVIHVRSGIIPTAQFFTSNNYSDGIVCRNMPVKFWSQSPGKYKWYFDDGTTDTISFPVKIYKTAGPHPVSLVVSNACLFKDSTFQIISSNQNLNSTLHNISFNFGNDQQDYNPGNNQPLIACPGDSIHFINTSGAQKNESLSFRWNFGNGDTSSKVNPVYKYTGANGNYRVILSAVNNCGATGIAFQYITIDNKLKPRTSLEIIPPTLCPGEKVFFFDNEFHEKYDRLKYSINFGDGDSAVNLVNLNDKDLKTLAEHLYADTGIFTYHFTAKNACNNVVTKQGNIHVTEVPHAPMYYVENSTQSNDYDHPADWSNRKLPGDAEMDIPVRMSALNSFQDSTFYLFFFRGGLVPNGEDNPAGIVKFKMTSAIYSVQFVKAYIPYDAGLDTVGIGFGHFCFSHSLSGLDKPDLYALPMTSGGQPIYKFAVSRDNITTLKDTITLPTDVTNVCATSKPYYGQWIEDGGDGEINTLEIKQSRDSLMVSPVPYAASKGYYRLTSAQGNKETEISSGYLYEDQNYLYFYDNKCPTPGTYMYNFSSQTKTLDFMNMGDACTARNNLLYMHAYTPKDLFDNTIASCQNTPVKFVIAGGDSVEWHFGDSVASLSTNAVAYHSYNTWGTFDAFAKVINGCGNIDTVRTKVVVSQFSTPTAQIYFNNGNSMVMTNLPVKFDGSSSGDTVNCTYFWNFGDGATSALSQPIHTYLQPGDYSVSLRVINNCGSDSTKANIFVSKTFTPTCVAEFTYLIESDKVVFYNLSDKPGYTYTWNFGDSSGTVTGKNPYHNFTGPGIYTVCLQATGGPEPCSSCQTINLFIENQCSARFYYSYQDSKINFTSAAPSDGIYKWNFGDGTEGYGRFISHSYANVGWFKVTLLTISPNCTDSFSNWVQVHSVCAQPQISMSVDSVSVQLNNFTNNKANYDWFWDYGDGTTSKAIDPAQHTFARTGVYYMYMTMFDPLNNCKIKMDTTILIGAVGCYAYFTANSESTDSTVVFNNHSSVASRYLWNFGDGTISYLQNPPVKKYRRPGIYNVCLTVSEGTCTQTYCKEISIGMVRCDADFAYTVDTVSSKVTFKNMSSVAANYYWDFGDGQIGSSRDTAHLYVNPGVYPVFLSIWNESTQCYNEITKTILVAGQSTKITTSDFDFFVNEGNDTVRFVSKSSPNVSKYYWTFGDGSFKSIKDPLKTYSRPGIYDVCLTVFDQTNGSNDRKCKKVLVGTEICNIVANIGFVVDNSSRTVHFADKSTGDYDRYYWTFGDGTTSADSAPVKTYSKPGYYLATFSVMKSGSNCVAYASAFIEIGQVKCKADFDFAVDDSTNEVTFTEKSTGAIKNYYWRFDDGNFSVDPNPVHLFAKQGMHNVFLTISDSSGMCMDNTEKKVQVGNVNCSAHFATFIDIPSLTVSCKNEAIGNTTQCYWYFGDGSASKDTNPIHQFNYPGYYTIGLTTFDPANWCMDSYQTTILVGEEGIDCKADFIYQVDTSNRKVNFSDNSIGTIEDYTWDFGDGIISTAKDTSHIYPKGGYYNVCLTVVNDKGVPNMNCKWIKVATDNKTDCYADFIFDIDSTARVVSLVSQSLGNPNSFEWNLGDSSTSTKADSLVHTYAKAGYYLVTLHIKTLTGCESYGYKLINIGQPDGIYAKFGYLARDYSAKAGGYPVDLVGAGIGDNSKLRWNFGDGSENSTSMSPTHLYTNQGTYWVCLTYSDTVTHEESTDCDSVSTQAMCQNDSIDPVARCKAYTLTLTSSPTDISPLNVDNGSTDDCGIHDYYLDNKTFTTANEGPNIIHLTVYDYNNNQSTCEAMVTVVLTGITGTSLNPAQLTVSPNPFNDMMNITYQLPVSCKVELTIYDLLGKKVATVNSLNMNQGAQVQSYDASRLKSGSYIVQLKASTGAVSRLMVVKR
jgi:PKD repeat protein